MLHIAKNVMTFEDFLLLKLALNRAGVPESNRVVFALPEQENAFRAFLEDTPKTREGVRGSPIKGKRFLCSIFDFEVWVDDN